MVAEMNPIRWGMDMDSTHEAMEATRRNLERMLENGNQLPAITDWLSASMRGLHMNMPHRWQPPYAMLGDVNIDRAEALTSSQDVMSLVANRGQGTEVSEGYEGAPIMRGGGGDDVQIEGHGENAASSSTVGMRGDLSGEDAFDDGGYDADVESEEEYDDGNNEDGEYEDDEVCDSDVQSSCKHSLRTKTTTEPPFN